MQGTHQPAPVLCYTMHTHIRIYHVVKSASKSAVSYMYLVPAACTRAIHGDDPLEETFHC